MDTEARTRPRMIVAVALVAGAAWVLAAQLGWFARDRTWAATDVSAERLADEGVVYVQEHEMFLVQDGEAIVGLSEKTPHMPGERSLYCPTSGWFETPTHGEKFDGLGHYADGPAIHGLDRIPARMAGGIIEIAPSKIQDGPPQGTPRSGPDGPFCIGGENGPPGPGVVEDPPGFLRFA